MTSRGAAGLVVDFVARQGMTMFGQDVELKFEARNMFGRRNRSLERSRDR